MPTERKVTTVAALTEKFAQMQLTMVADYRGMDVAELTQLRHKLREHGAEVIIAKNTLIRLAARQTGHQAIDPLLEGPTALALIYDNLSAAARDLQAYAKANSKLTIRGGLFGSSIISAEGLSDVANLPSRQELMGQILGAINAPAAGIVGLLQAPAQDMVRLMSAPITDLLGVLQARADQLQEAA